MSRIVMLKPISSYNRQQTLHYTVNMTLCHSNLIITKIRYHLDFYVRVHVAILYSKVCVNGQNRTGYLIANSSFKITYSHIKNAASIRYCMKVDLVVITVGGNMRPKKTAAFTV